MASNKSKAVKPIEYPSLQPWEYLHKAVNNGLTQQEAMQISGLNRGTWHNWLYRSNGDRQKPKKICKPYTEKLYRIAFDQGWLNDEAIAA
jgi:hypothetical protein